MANGEGTDPMEDFHTAFVETTLHTRLAILSHNHETISDFRDNFCKQHKQSFPEIGEISISALKVKRGGNFYRLPGCMKMSTAFEGSKTTNWFLNVDAARVENGEQLLAAVAEKKRKPKSLDGIRSRKKPSICLDQSAVATTPSSRLEDAMTESLAGALVKDGQITSRDDVTESHEACAPVQVAVAAEHCDTLPKEKLDDLLSGAIEKDIARGEGRSLAPGAAADNLQTAELVTDQEDHQLVEASNDFTISSKHDINQSTPAASTTSTKVVTEIIGVPGNEMGEKSVEDVGRVDNETDNLATQQEANSGLTTGPVPEKKKKQKKSSKDDMDQSLATTIQQENEMGEKKRRRKRSSRKVVKGAGGNGEATCTSESLAFAERGN